MRTLFREKDSVEFQPGLRDCIDLDLEMTFINNQIIGFLKCKANHKPEILECKRC